MMKGEAKKNFNLEAYRMKESRVFRDPVHGYFRMYYSIFLPLMKGALMTQLILWFMGIWNDYLAPTIFIQNEKWFTLQVVIRSFNSYYAVNSDYPLIMAASVLAILPTLLLFFFFQRYIIESLAVSGVKG